ncbi:MAG TPA: hypothetical protein VJH75_03400 [Patescibacteria group bacterium]|nr:hypothetical protein [Patescibacteria group bacterium]
MRQILSISLPSTDVKLIKKHAKNRGYDSISAYIQHLYKEDADLITEAELLKSVREARKEYRTGKTITAKSLADLV